MLKISINKMLAILLVATTSFVFLSCQQDDSVNNTSEIKSISDQSKSIIDYDVSMLPCEMTETDSLLAVQASQIIDNYILLQKDGYMLTASNGVSIGLSERVFNYYKTILNQTNEMLKGSVLIPLGGKSFEVRQPGYTPVETRAGGGVTKIVFYSQRLDIYLSDTALKGLASGYAFSAVLAGYAPPSIVTYVVKYTTAFCGMSVGVLALNHPNGVIISCGLRPGTLPKCLKFEMKPQ